MGLMGGGVWGVGYAIVDMRIRQVLKRFMGTPMKKPHFVAAMMFSRMIFMIPEIIVVLLVSRFLFGVINHGSYLNVMLLIVLGAFEFAGIGLLIASRAKTLEAVSGLMNLAMVPMWIGSGIFFSAKRFPEFVQPVIGLLPLTPVISALRQVMQEGAGTVAILPEIAVIAAWGVLTFAVAIRIFRWE
jgi:ABC-type polysaccharide/polyol phosphate export permease